MDGSINTTTEKVCETHTTAGPAVDALWHFIEKHPRLVIITGAGISAGSGIPTYRDEKGVWLRSDPIQHQAFVSDHQARQRYWLRSFAGWPAVSVAEPSPAHKAIARLEASGHSELLVTQNVDRLHQKAGSQRVIDLHGRLDEVICLACDNLVSRQAVQQRLLQLNPFLETTGEARPDGDADVDELHVQRVITPRCRHCDGILKPNVVFFGGAVDRTLVERIYRSIDSADALLVIGSSLKVFSGFRFPKYAAAGDVPVASINPGETRADPLLSLRIQHPADEILTALQQRFH